MYFDSIMLACEDLFSNRHTKGRHQRRSYLPALRPAKSEPEVVHWIGKRYGLILYALRILVHSEMDYGHKIDRPILFYDIEAHERTIRFDF